jgi:hypothetical protein
LPKRKRKISAKTRWAIRTYVKQGYSSNKIQKKLSKQGLGIRRKILLTEVRKLRGKKRKLHPQKYTPKKYRRVTPKARRPKYAGRHIAVYRYARTGRHMKPYSARFEFYGSGKDLGKAVRLVLSGLVTKWENPFVECSARAFLNNPYKYGERGEWVGKPSIES